MNKKKLQAIVGSQFEQQTKRIKSLAMLRAQSALDLAALTEKHEKDLEKLRNEYDYLKKKLRDHMTNLSATYDHTLDDTTRTIMDYSKVCDSFLKQKEAIEADNVELVKSVQNLMASNERKDRLLIALDIKESYGNNSDIFLITRLERQHAKEIQKLQFVSSEALMKMHHHHNVEKEALMTQREQLLQLLSQYRSKKQGEIDKVVELMWEHNTLLLKMRDIAPLFEDSTIKVSEITALVERKFRKAFDDFVSRGVWRQYGKRYVSSTSIGSQTEGTSSLGHDKGRGAMLKKERQKCEKKSKELTFKYESLLKTIIYAPVGSLQSCLSISALKADDELKDISTTMTFKNLSNKLMAKAFEDAMQSLPPGSTSLNHMLRSLISKYRTTANLYKERQTKLLMLREDELDSTVLKLEKLRCGESVSQKDFCGSLIKLREASFSSSSNIPDWGVPSSNVKARFTSMRNMRNPNSAHRLLRPSTAR